MLAITIDADTDAVLDVPYCRDKDTRIVLSIPAGTGPRKLVLTTNGKIRAGLAAPRRVLIERKGTVTA